MTDAFLNAEDFFSLIKEADLNQVTGGDRSLLDLAELTAQEEVESLLNQRFDMAIEFANTGTDRNPLLVMWMVDVTLYHLHTRISPRNIPQLRMDRYDMAITRMEKARDGKVTPNMTRAVNTDGENTMKSRSGGWDKQTNDW